MKTLLHVCCGPCSLEPSRQLRDEGHDLVFAYINPNIHPEEEYQLRLETLKSYTQDEGFELVEGSYDVEAWMEQVGAYGEDRAARCRACYRMRFKEAAALAKSLGCETLATTLSVSPYQDHESLFEELQSAADEAGLTALIRDFGPDYPATTQRAIERGMYRQNYCGCCFSLKEAERERFERKLQRKIEKLQLREAEAAQALEALEREQERLQQQLGVDVLQGASGQAGLDQAASDKAAADQQQLAQTLEAVAQSQQELPTLVELEKNYQHAKRLADEARLHLVQAQAQQLAEQIKTQAQVEAQQLSAQANKR